MSNSNHWDSLAASLGAETPPETAPAAGSKPVVKPPAASRPAAPAAPKKSPPPKSDTDWGQLASALGVAPSQVPQAGPASRPAPPQREAAPRRDDRGEPHLRPAREPENRGRERNRDRERPPRETQARDERREAPRHDERVDEPDFLFDEDPLAEILKAEAAESEGTSEAPPQPTEERTGRKRRRRRRGGRRSKRDRVAGDESAHGEPGEAPEAGEISFEAGGDEFEVAERDEFHPLDEVPAAEETSAEAPPGEDAERRGRPKRRRRRGSGRGRGRDERSAEAKSEVSRAPARDTRADEHDEDELHADEVASMSADDGMGDEDEGADLAGDKNSHRAIPAWDEAIGYIVSVNMESRAKNPKAGQQRGRGGRGRSSGRGAPRGGNGRRG